MFQLISKVLISRISDKKFILEGSTKGDPVLSTFLLDTVLSTFGFDRFIHKSYKIPFYPVFKNKLKLPFYPHFLVLKRFRDRFKCG